MKSTAKILCLTMKVSLTCCLSCFGSDDLINEEKLVELQKQHAKRKLASGGKMDGVRFPGNVEVLSKNEWGAPLEVVVRNPLEDSIFLEFGNGIISIRAAMRMGFEVYDKVLNEWRSTDYLAGTFMERERVEIRGGEKLKVAVPRELIDKLRKLGDINLHGGPVQCRTVFYVSEVVLEGEEFLVNLKEEPE